MRTLGAYYNSISLSGSRVGIIANFGNFAQQRGLTGFKLLSDTILIPKYQDMK